MRPAQAKADGICRELERVRRLERGRVGKGNRKCCGRMEAVVEVSNRQWAYERVVANEGAPGVDGLPVAEWKPWRKAHWTKGRPAQLTGEYLPSWVRKVDLPKPPGGVGTLGLATEVDGWIQQARHPVLQPLFDPEFCESSYGFRAGGNAPQEPW